VPKTVVYNSEVSYWQHVKFGFAADNAEIISNGFDTDAFRPNGDEKAAVRGELNIGNHSCVIGFVARDHPMKDLPTFVCAVRKILRKHGHVVVVVAGRGLDVSNRPLMELSGDRELGDRVICLGEYDKVEKLMRAFDVMVLSSAWGEGFPNVIGEAMATGVPCVATNVGECRTIIGKTGLVVEPQNPEQMAAAVSTLVNLDEGERKILGAAARQRIVEHYSLNKIVEKYQRLYQSLLVMP
jgi:glycosyltransferase involved in cell wall biosynthesis